MFRISGPVPFRRVVSVSLCTAGICALLLTGPSCTRPQTEPAPTALAPASQPVLHAVYAKELRASMRELDRAASSQVHWQIYTGQGPVVNMSQVADTADKMADIAGNRLPKLVSSNELPPDQLQIFDNLARRLHDQAVILKQEANRNDLIASQKTMNQIINTCNTCHTLFRGVTGPTDR